MKITYVTTVIYKPGQIPALRRVDDVLQVDSEQVRTPDSRRFVFPFPQISNAVSYHLTHVLDHHLVSRDGLHREQAPVVDGRLGELQMLFPEFELVELEEIRVRVAPEGREEPPLVRPRLPRQTYNQKTR